MEHVGPYVRPGPSLKSRIDIRDTRSRAVDEGVHIVSPPLAERVGPFCVPNVTVSVLPETAMLSTRCRSRRTL